MRVAIVNLTGGGMSGGYRAYLLNMLPRLAIHPEVEATLFAAPRELSVESWFEQLPTVRFTECLPFRFLRHAPDDRLREEVAQFSPDILFIPVERYCDLGHLPMVTMVQNMGPMVATPGNPLSERLRYIAQRYEAKIAVRKAKRVIVPTHFVRDFLTSQWGILVQRVRVVHYGSVLPLQEVSIKKPILVPERWSGQFIFTAGSIEPYRGLEDILHAVSALGGFSGIAGVVITGQARENMRPYLQGLKRLVARLGLTDRVVWAGLLALDAMSWCYSHARVFAMTSRVESMSMIGLEALAHGCVSVVADNPPFPEIFGDAARYYRPKDPRDLANHLQQILQWDASTYACAKALALARAATFSWDTAAEQTIEVFQEAIRENGV